LLDLVSYNEKHNEANGENNADGESNNRSWNCGAEGPTDDPQISALRARQQRNFLATVLLSEGVPMLCHGDELGRTQHGNNNGFCQDNATTWIDWEHADTDLIEFVRYVSAIRSQHPVFRRRQFFSGSPVRPRRSSDPPDIAWFRPDGSEMTDADWESGFGRSIAVYLNGAGISDRDARGERITDCSFVVCFNAHDEAIDFVLPSGGFESGWMVVLDTMDSLPAADPKPAEDMIVVGPRALVLLKARE
jgi:isoamylase